MKDGEVYHTEQSCHIDNIINKITKCKIIY